MRQVFQRFLRHERGVSAIEFALVAPIVLGVLAAVVDFGLLVQTRSSLESGTSLAMSYALTRAQDLEANNAVSFATSVAQVGARQMEADVAVTVTLNRSLIAIADADGPRQSGSGSAVNLCYCPIRNGSSIDWGDSQTCNSSCPDGGFAGRFLTIKASKHYQPLFIDYGLVDNGWVVIESMAGLQ